MDMMRKLKITNLIKSEKNWVTKLAKQLKKELKKMELKTSEVFTILIYSLKQKETWQSNSSISQVLAMPKNTQIKDSLLKPRYLKIE